MRNKYANFINGVDCLGSGKVIQVINPINGSVFGSFNSTIEHEVDEACRVARNALAQWKKYSVESRAEILLKASELMIADQGNSGDLLNSEIMELIVDEMGKSIYEAEIEIFESSDVLRYFATEGVSFIKDESPQLDQVLWPTKRSIIRYQPVGVVGIIKPWNYPLEIPVWSIGAALLCGNTVVFKPSELSPFIGGWLGSIFKKAGLPDGVFNVVLGDGSTGEKLVSSDIDMISFTGSTKTGNAIAQKCMEKNIKCSLELGGKDAFIVCHDADIERTVNGAIWGAYANVGQVCVSGERYFVHKDIYEEFVERIVEATSKLVVGNGKDIKTDVSSLVSLAQLNKVEQQVKDAVNKGARVLIGGQRLNDESHKNGFFYSPTVLVDVTDDMDVFFEETFGPIIAIQKFDNYDDVISKANSSKYGLGASVWTKSNDLAETIANALEVGMVWVNDINLCFPQYPWGGVKQSGIGCDLSKHGLYEYCTIKHINFENDMQNTQPWWYPYNK